MSVFIRHYRVELASSQSRFIYTQSWPDVLSLGIVAIDTHEYLKRAARNQVSVQAIL